MRIVLLLIFLSCSLSGQSSRLELQKQIFHARDQVLPALVHIEPIVSIYSRGEKQKALVTGSGVIFSKEGYVLTNHHVADNAEKVWCTLSSKERVTASVVGSDPSTDIAVLKLHLDELKNKKIKYARLGDSGRLEVGQIVLALGSPLGLSRSVSMGVISSIDRYFPSRGDMISPFNLWIQTDAAINPGNSGGPLINLNGEVVGINARGVMAAENLGFAIPINLVREVAEEIIEGSSVRRAWIGAEFQPIKGFQEYLRKNDLTGVLIASIEPNSPAAASGLEPGDVIQKINGNAVNAEFEEGLPEVRKIIASLPIEQKISLQIWRRGDRKNISLTSQEDPYRDEPELDLPGLGLVLKNIEKWVYTRYMMDDYNGAFIVSVKNGSISDDAGLKGGDVIRKVNDEWISDGQSFIDLFEKLSADQVEYLYIELWRGGHPFYTVVKLNVDAG